MMNLRSGRALFVVPAQFIALFILGESAAAGTCRTLLHELLNNGGNLNNTRTLFLVSEAHPSVKPADVEKLISMLTSIGDRLISESNRMTLPHKLELKILGTQGKAVYNHGDKTFLAVPLKKGFEFYSSTKKPWSKSTFSKDVRNEIVASDGTLGQKLHALKTWIKETDVAHRALRIYSKHPVHSQATAVHEFGHAIFDANLYNRSQEYRELTDSFKAYSVNKAGKKKQIEDLEALLSEATAVADQAAIEIRLAKLQDELFDFEERFWDTYLKNPFIIHEAEVSGYNELFADVTAVLFRKDPRAMYDSLAQSKIKQLSKPFNTADVDARDFTNKKNRLDNWNETEDPYGMFSPVRYFLYEKYLKRPEYLNSRASELYGTIFQAIFEEMTYRLRNPQVKLSAKAWNERLIKKIEHIQNPTD